MNSVILLKQYTLGASRNIIFSTFLIISIVALELFAVSFRFLLLIPV